MKPRTIVAAAAVAAASAAASAWGASAASASTVCNWGGTPAAQTGTFTLTPGLKTLPAAAALKFYGTGALSGSSPRCRGQVTYVGQVDAGSSCFGVISFEQRVYGLPGVAYAWGKGHLFTQEFLYDKAGNLVGSDQPYAFDATKDPPYYATLPCNSAEGFTHGEFSATIELFN
jgi:hypothetical protein